MSHCTCSCFCWEVQSPMCHLSNNLFRFSSSTTQKQIFASWVVTFGRFDNITLCFIDWQPRLYVYTGILRKVIRKSACDSAERYCVQFWVQCSTKKFARMAVEAMDLCSQVLKESNNSRCDSYGVRNRVLIIYHITLQDCGKHKFFHQPFSK